MRFISLSLFVTSFALLVEQSSPAQAPVFDPSRTSQSLPLRPDVNAQGLSRDGAQSVPGSISEENNFAVPSPSDRDLGQQLILKRNDRYKEFSISLDSSEFYTSNAANVHIGEKSDWFYVGGVSLQWQPKFTNRIYGDFRAGQHWFRYNEFSVLDYEDADAAAGVLLLMPEWWNTIWHVRYYYERITQGLGKTPTYQTHNIQAGVQKNILIDRLNSVNFGLLASLSLDATPSALQRHEYSLLTGWNYKIMRELIFSTSYHLTYFDYFNLDSRRDWYHNFGVALTWKPKDWLEIAASWNYTLNRSNKEAFTYDTQLAGPSLGVRWKF